MTTDFCPEYNGYTVIYVERQVCLQIQQSMSNIMIILLINHTTQNDPNAMLTMNTALDKLVKQAIPCTWDQQLYMFSIDITF